MPTISPPRLMRAVVFYAPRDIRLIECPIPAPEPGEIILKIEAALTCGTDFKAYRQGHSVLLGVPPSPFGHEMAGSIYTVGKGVRDFAPGQRVVAANSAPCDDCFYCRRGEPELCDHLKLLNGAYAEYIRIPAPIVRHNLLRIPENLPAAHAALAEPFACALHAVDKMALKRGDTVVLLGLGNMGRLLIDALRRLTPARVIALGRNAVRLKLAKQAGAHQVIDLTKDPDVLAVLRDSTKNGQGADAVIEAVGKPEAWELAMRLVRKGGQVCLFGGCAAGSKAEVDTHRLHYNELKLFGVFHHRPRYIQQAVELLSSGRFPTELFIEKEISLDEVPAFFQAHADHSALKAAVRP